MSERCVFLVSDEQNNKQLKEEIKKELSSGNIHEITPSTFKKKGGLAALINQTGKIAHVCVDGTVPKSEVNIALANNLSFHFARKGADGKDEIVHSSKINTSVNLN